MRWTEKNRIQCFSKNLSVDTKNDDLPVTIDILYLDHASKGS